MFGGGTPGSVPDFFVKASNLLRKSIPLLALVVLVCLFIAHFRATHVDYNTYQLAGERILSGKWHELYSPDLGQYGGFLYPLVTGFFFSTFTSLGAEAGRFVFYLLLFASWLAAFRFCMRLVPARDRFFVPSIAGLLSIRAAIDTFQTGNIGVLLIGMVFVALEPGAKPGASILTGLSGALKPFALYFSGIHLLTREWRKFAASTLTAIAFITGPFLIFGPSRTGGIELGREFLRTISNPGNIGGAGNPHFQSIPAAIHRLLSLAHLENGLWMKPLVLIVLILVFLFFMGSRRQYGKDPVFIAKYLALCPILYPASWYHMGLCYLPMLTILLSRALHQKDRKAAGALVLFGIFHALTGRSIFPGELPTLLENLSLPLIGALACVWQLGAPFHQRNSLKPPVPTES
ncbi:MAG: DUF2029 domain-containing protein [Proteobacteria bacterium]|nr:DUF2029 domain-containing protein [Pseudomonadota bacterium]